VPAATAGDGSSFTDVGGQIVFTSAGGNNGVTLRVPYYLVPQAVSKIDTKIDAGQLAKNLTADATITNAKKAPVAGAADWYAWGLKDKKDPSLGSNDLAAVGVQAFPGVVAFAIQTNHRWSNATMDEFDVRVDVNNDGTDDYDVVGADLGALTAGSDNGQDAVAVFDLRTGAGSIQFLADAPTDSSTIVLPVLVSQLCRTGSPCLSAANPRFTYHAVAFGRTDDTVDAIDGTASFNAFTPAISNGMFDVVNPGASAAETVSINAGEWAQTPALGLMIVSHGNKSGDDEAQLVKVDVK
jgi:minor extracellular serine protease Vpr